MRWQQKSGDLMDFLSVSGPENSVWFWDTRETFEKKESSTKKNFCLSKVLKGAKRMDAYLKISSILQVLRLPYS